MPFATDTHNFKAIAECADLVSIGRLIICSIALHGSKGVTQTFDFFKVNQLKNATSWYSKNSRHKEN